MSIKRNIVANYVGQGVVAALSIAFVPLYIRYLGIEAYGLIGLFTTIQIWLSLFDAGMSPTLNREMARFTAGATSDRAIRDLLHSVTLLCAAVALMVAAGLALASHYFATGWVNPSSLTPETVRQSFLVMASVVGLRFVEGVQRSALMGLQRQVWLNLLNVAVALLRSVGALAILAFVSPTLQAFMLWQGIVSLVSLAAIAVKLRVALPRPAARARFSWDALKEVRGFAGGMFGITLLAIMLTQVDKLLLSRLLPLDQFGYYMLAANVAAMLSLVAAPVTQAVFPGFVALVEQDDRASLAHRYHLAAQMVTVLIAPAALLLMAFPHTALIVWSNDPMLAARTATQLALLAAGCFVNALMYVPHHLQLANGWTSLSIRFNMVAVALLIPALLWAAPIYGATAAALIYAGLNVAYLLLQIPMMHRRLLRDEQHRWYIGDVALPTAAAATVIVGARLIVGDAATRYPGAALLVGLALAASVAALLAAGGVRGVVVAQARALLSGCRGRQPVAGRGV